MSENKISPLRFTVNSVCRLEEALERPLQEWLKTDVRCIRALLWCGWLHDAPALTLPQAGRRMDDYFQAGGKLAELSDACVRGLADAGFYSPPEEAAPSGGNG